MLQSGIIGLPNVGKSTLFNALVRCRKAEAANYPFCTIEPNVGIVTVPDERLAPLAQMVKTEVIIPAAIQFVDIAGLVAGASRGEGLGNRFLGNIREVDAIIHVVRCFDEGNIVHHTGVINPVEDTEIIMTELILADLQSVENQLQKWQKKIKSLDKEARANILLLEKIQKHLNQNKPAHTFEGNAADTKRLTSFCLLSHKPILHVANIPESDLVNSMQNPYVVQLDSHVKNHYGTESCPLCARLEEELGQLGGPEQTREYLDALGITDSGVTRLIQATYARLGLASYFTAGEKEVRAWTFKQGMTAPECAGIIHTDFERGFIKAEVVSYNELMEAGSMQAAKEAGKYRLEGKDYRFQDGDVVLFRFNT